MSARHRHHKKRVREVEGELDANDEMQKATKLVMSWLLAHGNDKMSIGYHTLEHVIAHLEHDRDALLEVIQVLAPGDWRWRMRERWRSMS